MCYKWTLSIYNKRILTCYKWTCLLQMDTTINEHCYNWTLYMTWHMCYNIVIENMLTTTNIDVLQMNTNLQVIKEYWFAANEHWCTTK